MTSSQGLYDQFSFEKSGLPDHPAIRTAFDLMLKCEIDDSPLHYKAVCIERDIRLARFVAEGWSSDPEVISAALLRDAYPNAKNPKAFRAATGDRITNLVEETAGFEAGEDSPARRRWSADAKAVIYADCVLALTRWNDSLSKSFREIAERNQGQIVDPQYLGPHGTLVAAVSFIQKEVNAGDDAPAAPVAKAITKALAASVPVTASIQSQAAKLAKGYARL